MQKKEKADVKKRNKAVVRFKKIRGKGLSSRSIQRKLFENLNDRMKNSCCKAWARVTAAPRLSCQGWIPSCQHEAIEMVDDILWEDRDVRFDITLQLVIFSLNWRIM